MLEFKSYLDIDVSSLYGLRYDLYCEVFGVGYSDREKGITQLNRLLKFDPRFSWSIWDEGRPVAFLNVESGNYLGEPIAYLNLLGVLPEYRKQGLGSKLMDLTAQSAAAAGCRLNYLESVAKDSHVWQHYERINWSITRSYLCFETSRKKPFQPTGKSLREGWNIVSREEYAAETYKAIDQYPASWVWRPEAIAADAQGTQVLELHDAAGCFAYALFYPLRATIVRLEASHDEEDACSLLLDAMAKMIPGKSLYFYHIDSRRSLLCALLEAGNFRQKLKLHEMVKKTDTSFIPHRP